MSFELVMFDQFGQALARIAEDFPDLIVGSLQRTAREARAILVYTTRETKPYAPVDTGAYMRAWTRIEYETGVDIINDAPQAPVMEWGAKPFHISRAGREDLAEWVLRKSRGAWNKGKGPRRKGKYTDAAGSFTHRVRGAKKAGGMAAALKAAESIAWAISRKFAREGIEGRHVLGRSWPRIVRLVEVNLDEDIRRAAHRRYGR